MFAKLIKQVQKIFIIFVLDIDKDKVHIDNKDGIIVYIKAKKT